MPVATNRSSPRQRASSACDFCHSRGLRCRSDPQCKTPNAPCLTCHDYGATCTRERPIRRRGRKPAARALQVVSPSPEPGLVADGAANDNGLPGSTACGQQSDFKSPQTVRRLLNIYVDTMYQC